MTATILDEALDRLRDTGPERVGWLSNHAPMAVEALAHAGYGHRVHQWIDGYADRLEERPRGIARIALDEWRDPLGDPVRTGDWLDLFERELRAAPWRGVLLRWWPRLLPGIAAGATHGVIRVGHAVRALQEIETPARVTELGQGLAYWAARWQPLAPAGAGPYRSADPRAALDAVPRVPDQRFGIRHRLAQLADLPRWPEAAGAIPDAGAGTAAERLATVVRAAAERHGSYGYANPVMLVHAVTAPNAVMRVLPVLPEAMRPASLAAAWAATAAVTAVYAPAKPRPLPQPRPDLTIAELASRAVAIGDPHAIKYADAVADVLAAAPDPALLAAAVRSVDELAD
ncbi:questin oxidase family protein [Micromonospora chokoriensis]|uniref:questin oxidase family protein n=1 Tax=Micromonospora chokoriensis TaxID=356851 RepID=UPI0004C31553|nr:questin oxidase family protein [Micromonospora chokoriensis]